MERIAGLLRRSGSATNPDILNSMMGELESLTPARSGAAVQGVCAIGQLQANTTPESRYEAVPEQSEGYLLAVDGRIDNRDEVRTQLDISPDPVVTDSDLILAAYDRWGRNCPEHLVGAYAFAIWDINEERLFCARDHVGIRPFFYADTDDVFAFASEMSPLLNREFVSDDIDEIAVGDFLLGFLNTPERTFYEDIRTLPPAHWAIVDANSIEIQRYWSLNGPEIDLDSDEAYLEEFRNRFEQAVRARLRSPADVRVGSTLSGGLDSSSISCVADALVDDPLPTFSVTFDDIPGSDESEYIDAVHEHLDFDSHFVRGENRSPFQHADEMLDRLDEPNIPNTLYIHWEMYRSASNADVRILLDGFGGDQTISHGLARFPELAVKRHPLKLSLEMWKYTRRFDSTLRWLLYDRLMKPLEPDGIRHFRREHFGTGDPVANRSDVIDESFVNRIDLQSHARKRESRRRGTTQADHRRILGDGSQATGLEVANLSAATFGIEPRYPFFDRRLMEFCFRTPGHLKFRDGWRRWILRNALSDVLPAKIRDRTTKGDLAVAYYETLRSRDRDELDELFSADRFPPYLDRERVRSEWDAFLDGDESNVLGNVWRPALLCRWFQLTDRYE